MNTDQTLNLPAIGRFLTDKDAVLLFLLWSFVFAVVLVVFVQPLSVLSFTSQTGVLHPLAQLALMAVVGYSVVLVSRLVLLFVSRRREFSIGLLAVWMAVELVVCVAVTVLVEWAISGAGTVQLAPLAGDVLLGNVSVFFIPNVVAYQTFRLHELRDELSQLRRRDGLAPAASMAERTMNFYDKGGRLSFSTRLQNVLYIEAADNYANIHYLGDNREETFILHNSLKDIERDFADAGLMRCHRGYMVNVYNVKLMRKDKTGLVLELASTAKTIPVSKSYAAAVTAYFSSEMSQPEPQAAV